mgnify:CR=1 FL=1
MKLITKEIERAFKKHPLYSQENEGLDAEVVVKFFNPCGAETWLITEGNLQDDGDFLMYGYCYSGNDEMSDFGYITLSQLENKKLPLNIYTGETVGYLEIERDKWLPKNCTLESAMKSSKIPIPSYLKEKISNENLKNIMKENDFLTTNSLSHSIFMLKDGTMINGFIEGIRCIEHREVAESFITDIDRNNSNFWPTLHKRTGIIMVSPETNKILIMKDQELSKHQKEVISLSNDEWDIEEYCQENQEEQINEMELYEGEII